MSAALLIPFSAAISVQLMRIEGRHAPLAIGQAICGACLVMEFVFPLAVWQNAAFRPEADAVIIQRLNDLAWLPFLGIICTLMMQQLLIAWAILQDRREDPLFPRWVGFFNVWMAFMVAPASLIPFFKTGPFAWNGLLAWWVAVVSFCGWSSRSGCSCARSVEAPGRSARPTP